MTLVLGEDLSLVVMGNTLRVPLIPGARRARIMTYLGQSRHLAPPEAQPEAHPNAKPVYASARSVSAAREPAIRSSRASWSRSSKGVASGARCSSVVMS